ncbi:MAG: hypothetical protein JW395_3289 [Nitrospira sp.]|nr:hypothetical protein [Nitrospira sp.]
MGLGLSPSVTAGGELDLVPISAINHYLFCSRRAALINIEGVFKDNHHTLRGDMVHENADLAGYEVAKGVTLLRALPVWSARLGLNGKCDIVEQRPDGSLFPVEFKLGKRRKWENDDAQLCAQALCLEEMFGLAVPCGAIFHADSKRRREVQFDDHLRARTSETVQSLHEMIRNAKIPHAEYRDACQECSLFDVCLPKATGSDNRASRLARQLFEA